MTTLASSSSCREQIFAAEPDKLFDAGGARCRLGLGDTLRVDIDAESAGAAACGGNNDAAVATAKVDEMISRPYSGEIEHALDQRLGRRPEGRVEMVRRAGPRAADCLERAIFGLFGTGHARSLLGIHACVSRSSSGSIPWGRYPAAR